MSKTKLYILLYIMLFVFGLLIGHSLKDCPVQKETICQECPSLTCPEQRICSACPDCVVNPTVTRVEAPIVIDARANTICEWESKQPTVCFNGLKSSKHCNEDEYAKRFNTSLIGSDNRVGCYCKPRRCYDG